MPRARSDTPVDPALFHDLPHAGADALADGAELEGVRIGGEQVELNATRLSLDTVRCDALHVAGAHLPRLSALHTWWEDCDLSNCECSGAAIRHAVLRRVRLTGVELAESALRDVLVEDCKIDLANLRFAKLERVTFRRCLLNEADFSGSEQRAVRYEECDLRAAQFSQAKLHDVDLRGSKLEGLSGLGDMRGARISNEQLLELAPAMAAQLGLRVEG